MPVVFISYRRGDSAGHAGRMFDHLARRFGHTSVFMDVAGIKPGVDFVDEIDRAVGRCDVLIVVIGREWLTSADGKGRRRLDDAADFVRVEVAAALKRNVRVIPALVEGATMPAAEALPADLRPLARRNAIELSDTRWDSDLGILMKALEGISADDKPHRKRWRLGVVAAIPTVAIAASVAWFGLGLGPKVVGNGGHPKPADLSVPKVLGMLQAEAERALTDAGFSVGPIQRESASGAKRGTIMRTVPAAGTLATRGSQVTLVVAQAETPVSLSVPKVAGMPQAEAERALRDAGFTLGKPRVQSTGKQRSGTVLSTDPPANTSLAKESIVSLVIEADVKQDEVGEKKVAVPGVRGMTRADAQRALLDAGFVMGKYRVESTGSLRSGFVLSTDPPEKTSLPRGSTVSLVIEAAVATVPYVAGKSRRDAEQALIDAGFVPGRPREESTGRDPGLILFTDPPASTSLPRGSTVTLVVEKARREPGGIVARSRSSFSPRDYYIVDLDLGRDGSTGRIPKEDLDLVIQGPSSTAAAHNGADLQAMTTKPDYDLCTHMRRGTTSAHLDLRRGSTWLCVYTNLGRYAVVGIQRDRSGSGGFVIDYVTYQPAR